MIQGSVERTTKMKDERMKGCSGISVPMRKRFVGARFFVILGLSVILSIFVEGVRSKEEARYRNLYGYDEVLERADVARMTGGLLRGGLGFLREGDRILSSEVIDAKMVSGGHYDFIVIGAGTAGATIASRLSEIKEINVLLIEAGGNENLVMDIPLAANLLQFSGEINWNYKTEPSDSYCLGMKNRQCRWPRGRVMGGSSVLNYMIATRGNERDYDNWARMGNEGWSWNEVLPYFKKLEKMRVPEMANDTGYHNTDGPLNIDYVSFRTPVGDAFVKAGEELGWDNVDYNGERQTGFSYIQTNTKEGLRHSSNRAYLQPVRKRRNLVVSKNSLVTKIIFKDKRAVGVEFVKANRLYKVWATKEVILSAGAINSPHLLMLSGVGPKEHLNDLGIKTVQDLPGVGENLQDHIAYGGLVFVLDQPVGIALSDMINPANPYIFDYLLERKGPIAIPGAAEGIAFVNVDDPKDEYPNIELFFVSASLGTVPIFRRNLGLDEDFYRKSYGDVDSRYSWSIFPMLMRPTSRGKILLKNSNPRAYPRIIANYMNHTDDVRLLIKGVRLAIRVANTRAMKQFGSKLHMTPISGCESHEYDTDDYWECAIRRLTMNIYHYCGTCKMGPQGDPTAVVDPRLKVYGVDGLRVADASIMPDIPTGHTNIPTHMIAEKLADMVKQDWGYPIEQLTT